MASKEDIIKYYEGKLKGKTFKAEHDGTMTIYVKRDVLEIEESDPITDILDEIHTKYDGKVWKGFICSPNYKLYLREKDWDGDKSKKAFKFDSFEAFTVYDREKYSHGHGVNIILTR